MTHAEIHAITPMTEARSHFAAAVWGGKLYVFGGGGSDFASLDSVEVYDPITDVWTARSPMPSPRSGITASAVGDRIYVMGGGFRQPDGSFDFKSQVDAYLPAEDKWESAPSLGWRHDAPDSVTVGNRLYLFGGHHPDAVGGPMHDPAFDVGEMLIPGAKKPVWKALPPMPTPRFSLVTTVLDGQIWCMGGGANQGGIFANLDTIEIYDPADNQWRRSPTHLPWPAAGLYGAVWEDGLVVAGGNDEGRISPCLAYFRRAENRWHMLPDLPAPRVMGQMRAVVGQLLLVGGREEDAKTPSATCFRIELSDQG